METRNLEEREDPPSGRLWTIGHSTRSVEELLELLRENAIETVADVRRFPGSRRNPQFNKSALEESLRGAGLEYRHLLELGGHRTPRTDSRNTIWRNDAFRGYADYMETEEFRSAVDHLLRLAGSSRTAMMCAEASWASCHRALVSDYLKSAGAHVVHIVERGKVEEHPYTRLARVMDGRLSYHRPAGEGES